MKKILLLISILSGILFTLKIQTNATTIKAERFCTDSQISSTNCLILTKGYYVIVYDTINYNVKTKGDSFNFVLETPLLDGQIFTDEVDCEYEYINQIDQMCDLVNQDYPDLSKYQTSLIRVNSYMVVFSSSCITYNGYRILTSSSNEIGTHITNIDNLKTLDDFKKEYTATDNVDGTLTPTFESNYNHLTATLGTYYILATVTDSAGLTTYSINYIKVHDFTAPKIEMKTDIVEYEVYETIDINELKKNFVITDNFPHNLDVTYTSTYENDNTTLTTYHLYCIATDQCGNKSNTATLDIKIKDSTKPTISLKEGGNTILATDELTKEQIFELLLIEDNYDTMTFDKVTITTNSEGKQGIPYKIFVTATDSSNNSQTAEFQYMIKDTTYPIITVNNTIYLEQQKNYTTEEILQLLKESGIISNDATTVNIISQELIEETETKLTYKLLIEEKLSTGETNYSQIKMVYPNDNAKNNTKNYYLFIIIGVILVGTTTGIIIKKKHDKN